MYSVTRAAGVRAVTRRGERLDGGAGTRRRWCQSLGRRGRRFARGSGVPVLYL